MKANEILMQQIAIDYCCLIDDVKDGKNHFTLYQELSDRRSFQEADKCFLKICVINGKVLFNGQKDIIEWCKEQYESYGSEWFFEAKNMHKLNERLMEDGYQIESVHPFFIPSQQEDIFDHGHIEPELRYSYHGHIEPELSNSDAETCSSHVVAVNSDYEIKWYDEKDILQFKGDDRFDEAFIFCEGAPDVLGVAAIKDGEILGMAGASQDSKAMWQIGINVDKKCSGSGIAKMLVTLIKNEILKRGILPFYGTSMSHLASQRVALASGFKPAWVELYTTKRSSGV